GRFAPLRSTDNVLAAHESRGIAGGKSLLHLLVDIAVLRLAGDGRISLLDWLSGHWLLRLHVGNGCPGCQVPLKDGAGGENRTRDLPLTKGGDQADFLRTLRSLSDFTFELHGFCTTSGSRSTAATDSPAT